MKGPIPHTPQVRRALEAVQAAKQLEGEAAWYELAMAKLALADAVVAAVTTTAADPRATRLSHVQLRAIKTRVR